MTHSRITEFRRLHQAGCFVMPNPWDAGSARLLAQMGFPALATTSAGVAWSMGRRDNHVALEECLARLRSICASVDLPVNADFEGGFATEPQDIAAHVALAVTTSVAGLSIEDSTGDASEPLFDRALAVERIRAARRAIDESGTEVVLTGRAEGFIAGRPDLHDTIGRLQAYADGGADCLYAPGLQRIDDIATVVRAVAPKPVNVLVGSPFTTVAQLEDVGVRRISVGGALARVAWRAVLDAAREIAERGTFNTLATGVPFGELEAAFPRRPDQASDQS